jgi:prepilin-type N-terminal cleavage/methylation domain-containing protein
MKLKNKKAFTLIELMIVISIIAILLAVAIPRFSSMYLTAKWAEKNHARLSSDDYMKLNTLGYSNKQILKINISNMRDILSKIGTNSNGEYIFLSAPVIRPENGDVKTKVNNNYVYPSSPFNNSLNNNTCNCDELYKEIYELRKKLEERR